MVLFSETTLGAIAASYLRMFPKVRLKIISDDRVMSPVENGFDLFIHVNPRPTDEPVGRCLLKITKEVVAAPSIADILRSYPRVLLPSVVIIGASEDPWCVDGEGWTGEVAHRPVMCVSSLLTAHNAVLSGAGAAVLPSFMIADDIAAGRLASLGESRESAIEI